MKTSKVEYEWVKYNGKKNTLPEPETMVIVCQKDAMKHDMEFAEMCNDGEGNMWNFYNGSYPDVQKGDRWAYAIECPI